MQSPGSKSTCVWSVAIIEPRPVMNSRIFISFGESSSSQFFAWWPLSILNQGQSTSRPTLVTGKSSGLWSKFML